MNYNYLRYFKVLAETEHYTHAANLLGISQPSLSNAINQLEEELSVPLFEKQGRNIRLNKYGKLYYDYIKKGLDTIDHGNAFIQSLASQDAGTIDLGFIYTLGANYMPNMIQQFLVHHPNITFNLTQGTTADILQQLRNEELDIGFCSMIKDAQDINFIPIKKEEMVLVVSSQHPLASLDHVDLTQLGPQQPWITYAQRSGLYSYLDQMFKNLNINPHIICSVEEDSVMLGLVGINYGVAVMPRIPQIELHPVKALTIDNPLQERLIYMANLKNRYMTPSVRKLINFILHQ